MEETKINERFFAAANSYNGFISFFDKVFNSDDYERIYVLKGGPGTGKSSLMKRIAEAVLTNGGKITEILCSSDPHSLDGIIASNREKKIAILDGTAPHERDAVVPGAIDEIIDLGRCWDGRLLKANREKILALIHEKKKAYSAAYSYLSLAGNTEDFVDSIYKKIFMKYKAKDEAEKFLSRISISSHGIKKRHLVSSFGRYGSYRLDTFERLAKNRITICGHRCSTLLFLSTLVDLLRDSNLEFIDLPMALSPEKTEGIFIPKCDVLISTGADGEINADEFLSSFELEKERIRCAEFSRENFLDEAQRWFAIASDLHFRLEGIYSKAMDFTENDKIIEEKTKEILEILDL